MYGRQLKALLDDTHKGTEFVNEVKLVQAIRNEPR